MKRLALGRFLLVFAAAALLLPAGVAAKTRPDAWNLHPGSHGPRVGALQWMLSGHCPNKYAPACGGKAKATLHHYFPSVYGPRTKHGLLAYRYRLGFPAKGQCGARASKLTTTVTPWFFALLKGKVTRPVCWVGLAAKRIEGLVVPGASKAALRIKALELSQLGVTESPWGSNRGPRISYVSGGYGPYQGSTGAYGLAWCASFGDWALKHVTGHGFGSSNDAYVPAIVGHAQARGWLEAKPRVGSYVAFLTASGRLASAYHIGYVISLVGSSGVMTVEGNSNQAVREVYRRFGVYNMIYIAIPGVA